MAKIRIILREG